MSNLKREYSKLGFVHLKQVLNSSELDEIRRLIKSCDSGGFVKEIDFFLEHKTLYQHQFNSKILDALKEIFGDDYRLVNDINIQVEQYYNARKDKGWHFDAGHERLAKYLFGSGYGFCKVGIYTEPNTLEYGGGIDVEMSGHKSFKSFGSGPIAYCAALFYYFFDRLILSPFRKKVSLQTRAGDVVIFDSRLPHRSTPRKMEREGIHEPKISVYWQVAKDSSNAQIYLKAAMHMAFFDKNNFKHYRQFLSYYYPAGFPKEYVDLAQNSSGVSSLSEKVSKQYAVELHSGTYEEVFFNN
jgi:hypothetical protein